MTTELIVVDENCGTPLSRCLRFCQSPEYQFYCDLSCNTNRLNWPVVCGVSASASYYDPKISSTFRSLDDEKHGLWKAQFQDRRRMIGKFGIEDLVIQTKDNEAAIKVDFEFVHAFSMDIRLFQVDDSNAVFGIAPGRRSTILRLFEANIIAKPLLSISLLKTEMVFGDLDRKNCENDWEFHSTVKDDRWTIAVDSIYISHVGTFGKGLAHLQTHWPVIGVPTKVIEKLIEEKVITPVVENDPHEQPRY
ncbi:hypothetical protein M3Y98_01177200 [Aphelenchoides besseyi]|nr:hypothetical protein M3Y98_01177200 [Aphelenchoides besseyi]